MPGMAPLEFLDSRAHMSASYSIISSKYISGNRWFCL